jgi:hypothetical protein
MPYKEGQTATLPDGSKAVFTGGQWHKSDAPIKASEDQSKAQDWAKDMRAAESTYIEAQRKGYDPTAPRNAFATFLEGLPLVGNNLNGVGAYIRDDSGDMGRQAELQWTDARLKAKSGAAAPEAEVKRNVDVYFARPGQNGRKMGDVTREARRVAFEATKTRSGPYARTIGDYPSPVAPPKVGEVRQGYRFTGGNPADPNSWAKQ